MYHKPADMEPLLPSGAAGLEDLAREVVSRTAMRGQMSRGDIIRHSGMAERTGRQLLGQLHDEGVLVSDSPKGNVRLDFPTHVASYLFPELYPAQVV